MRRTDRLFELIQILRDGRLHRAEDTLDVSEDFRVPEGIAVLLKPVRGTPQVALASTCITAK